MKQITKSGFEQRRQVSPALRGWQVSGLADVWGSTPYAAASNLFAIAGLRDGSAAVPVVGPSRGRLVVHDLPPERTPLKVPRCTCHRPCAGRSMFEQSVTIMARLRAPRPGGALGTGNNPFDSIRKYTLEETYEVFDAIERRDFPHLAAGVGRPVAAGAVLCGDGGQRGPFHHC